MSMICIQWGLLLEGIPQDILWENLQASNNRQVLITSSLGLLSVCVLKVHVFSASLILAFFAVEIVAMVMQWLRRWSKLLVVDHLCLVYCKPEYLTMRHIMQTEELFL